MRRFILGALTLLLTACGGGDGTTTTGATASAIDADGRVTIDHLGFRLLYDCQERSTVRYEYTLTTDTGSLTRPTDYTVEPLLPADCPAQSNTGSYASVHAGFDRGHLVTSNHMDGNADWLLAANHMSNIVPQVSTFNQGLWLEIENVAECYRDIAPVRVIGGVVYDDASNDWFVNSHGVRTPDRFWKLIVTADPATGATRAIAWIVPNQPMLNTLDTYLVSVATLEQQVGAAMVAAPALPAAVRTTRPTTSWALPSGCSLG